MNCFEIRMKAFNVATKIFDFHMKSSRFEETSDKVRLETLSKKAETLKTDFSYKELAVLVSERLEWFMDDYMRENNICLECFEKVSQKSTFLQTYWEREEGDLVCESCQSARAIS